MRNGKIFWYAQWQKFLVCAGAGQFGMRKRSSSWYAQAQVILECVGASQFGMRRRRSNFIRARATHFFYAQGISLLPYDSSFFLDTF